MRHTHYTKFGHTIGMLLLAVCLSFVMVSPVVAGQIYQYKANEDYAQALLYNGSAKCYVQVSKGGTVSNPQTYLNYWIEDFAAGTYSYGNGVIPNGDLRGNWQTGLTLTTDTSRMTGGQVYGYTGYITVRWNNSPNGLTYRVAGTRDVKQGVIVSHYNGISNYGDAVATGTVFYSTFENAVWGYMGTNNQVNVTVEKVQ